MPESVPPTATFQNARALAFLRIAVGVFFFIFGEYKVFGAQFTLHGGFQYWINQFLQGGAYPFMVSTLRGFVLTHATPIAFLVAYGELAILETYLPAGASEAEMDSAIAKAIAETGANSIKQMGALVKAAKAHLEGKAVDGKALSDRVRARLS